MGVSHGGRFPGFGDEYLEVVREVGTDRSRPHRAAIAAGAFSIENTPCRLLPRDTFSNGLQDAACRASISAICLATILLGESTSQPVALDRLMSLETAYDGLRHDSVVRVKPRRRRYETSLQSAFGGHRCHKEEALTKGIADGKAFKREESAFETSLR